MKPSRQWFVRKLKNLLNNTCRGGNLKEENKRLVERYGEKIPFSEFTCFVVLYKAIIADKRVQPVYRVSPHEAVEFRTSSDKPFGVIKADYQGQRLRPNSPKIKPYPILVRHHAGKEIEKEKTFAMVGQDKNPQHRRGYIEPPYCEQDVCYAIKLLKRAYGKIESSG